MWWYARRPWGAVSYVRYNTKHMMLFVLGWFFVFGAIIGSFLNVVILRMGTGRSLSGRSHCLSCGATLAFFELVPVLSWLAAGGRCRHCSTAVSAQYLLVELATAVLFVWIASVFWPDPIALSLALAVGAVLMIVLVYDLRHTIVPNVAVGLLLALALAFLAHESIRQSLSSLIALLGWVFPSGVLFALWYVSSGRWVGLGDVKLAVPLGLILGVGGSISLLLFAFWIGAAVMLALLALQWCARRGKLRAPFLSVSLTMKSKVPFAPFLIAAFLLVWLCGADALALAESASGFLIGT